MKKRKKHKDRHPISYYLKKDWLKTFWKKHWEMIITVALALIISRIISTKFFR